MTRLRGIGGRPKAKRVNPRRLPLRWGLILIAGISAGLVAGRVEDAAMGLAVGVATATFLHSVLD